MKIAIVTLPFHTNYGGVLQAYALKTCLEGMGHQVAVLDRKYKVRTPVWWKAPMVYLKRGLLRLIKGSKAPEVFRECRIKHELPIVSSPLRSFIDSNMHPYHLDSFNELKEGDFDAYVVGSDQVWRPVYVENIYDYFLEFTAGWDVRRVVYAASFGTTELEFEFTQLEKCSELLSDFNAVSVREDAAVKMCDEWLDYESAVHVVDPVMLLDKEHYLKLADIPGAGEFDGKVLSYILDKSEYKTNVVDFVCRCLGKEQKEARTSHFDASAPLDQRVIPSLEKWIGAFANADFVVTDSFHGCVLSLMLHKPFLVTGNSKRGLSRIESLLKMFDLDYRMVDAVDPEDDGEGWLTEMDWEYVDKVLKEKVDASRLFLDNALNCK